MKLTVAKALEIPSVSECKVIGGKSGLSRPVDSVNSFDAPDVVSWLKPNELVLTTGYVFNSNPDLLLKLVEELAAKGCAGLGIKSETIPDSVIRLADSANLPLLRIPEQFSLADIMTPLLRELVARQKQNENFHKNTQLLSRIISGNPSDFEIFTQEAKSLGLSRNSGYMCILLKLFGHGGKIGRSQLLLHTEQMVCHLGIGNSIYGWVHSDMILILENKNQINENQINAKAYRLSEELDEFILEQYPGIKHSIGIGNHHIGIDQITRSFSEASKAIHIGNCVETGKRMFSFKEMEAISLLQYSPPEVLEDYVFRCLSPLLVHDQTHNTELVRTLDVFLHSLLRPAETARALGIHRNTVHFRLNCIKDILENDLIESAYLFRLQLALYAMKLLGKT
ncbi:PucR family transcriptional regulator [Mesobacillus foraminis]|uniref:PucR-like helix-turn-helix protein n=1 Tax=Mesobacillus foraminis TaxID=279826 RepID=A0A4R2BMI8_9BACI|nr:PucR family transcriptional regulator [Mesobacillus foraminis]TCN27409.1 PucR-like helix-turn-helix protein [Mesobacillus foraminis]